MSALTFAEQSRPQPSAPATFARRLLQLLIGIILLASALGKSLDLPAFVEVLKTYRAFPDVTLWPLALGLTSFEFIVGLWLLCGWRLPTSALVAAGLNAAYAVWMAMTLLRGLDLPNCGCFGVFSPQPLRWYSPLEDLVLVAMGLVLRWLARIEEQTRFPPH
ncbi:MAG: MauE/DoxX family redox-associated membrane protein [Nitrospiraceae bacterium]